MSLISEYAFDQLRNLIAKEIGLQTTREHFNEVYDFLGSEGTLIKYLKTINLCNDKYNTTFHCHLCEKNFNWKCMIGSIGCVITDLEYSICAKLLPSRCQHCQTTITDSFERLSSESISIPPLLTIEIGHLPEPSKLLLLSDIDTEFTISHGEKVLRYELAGLSIHLTNHLYYLVRLEDDFYRYDGVSLTPFEYYPSVSFLGNVNTIFYTLLSTE